jgi:hypothetical protein
MSDEEHPRSRRPRDDYAAQMARSEFGRHYLDPERVEQILYDGEIVVRLKKRPPPRRE